MTDTTITALDRPDRADLTAATTALRDLYAAGWTGDYVTPMGVGSTEFRLIHPTGRAITALVNLDGRVAELSLIGLTMTEAIAAVRGAGLAPATSADAEDGTR